MFMHTWYSARNYRRQMSNGSILAEEFFYILAQRNIWKLILFFFLKNIFSGWKKTVYSYTYFTHMFMQNIFNAINI